MQIIRDDIWLCVDCTVYACNGDLSGVDDAARVKEIEDGVNALGSHLAANFDTDSGEGHEEFSRRGCDACGSGLAGEFHRFAILGEGDAGE